MVRIDRTRKTSPFLFDRALPLDPLLEELVDGEGLAGVPSLSRSSITPGRAVPIA
jgi:hypothetical protein